MMDIEATIKTARGREVTIRARMTWDLGCEWGAPGWDIRDAHVVSPAGRERWVHVSDAIYEALAEEARAERAPGFSGHRGEA